MKAEENQFDSGEFDIEIKKYERVWCLTEKPYYAYEIIVKKKGENGILQILSTFKRRYSDFEELQKDLEKFNPGCKILELPEKHISANLPFTNEDYIAKRMEGLDKYLRYLIKHKHLKTNTALNKFLSAVIIF